MRDSRVASRYAHALFSVAISREIVDIVASELFQLKSFAEKDKRFLRFLEAPQVLGDDKVNLIKSLFTSRLSPPLVSFLLLLIEKNRIEFLSEIAGEFEKMLENYRGIIRARVTTAIQISEEYKQALRTKLEKLSGQKIEIIHKIDREIIGGIIVQLNYKVIDRSIRHELGSLRHDLLALKVF
jgi:F-type H+-transporting ATPase subunit delta